MPIQPVWDRWSSLPPRRFRVFLYGLILAGVGVVGALGINLTILATASSPEKTVAVKPAAGSGALVICGGGEIPDSIYDRFVELAGGPRARIVVIPTAHGFADGPGVKSALNVWKTKKLASVQLFHTRSRDT